MKYALLILLTMPLFADDFTLTTQRLEEDLAQGRMIPIIENGEVKSWLMDPTTNTLENQKITKVEKDTDDEE